MRTSDVFALDKSGLNTFLFAEVGTEANGSMLTVLSVLARLGQDPWDQAARWAELPKATIVDRLTECIRQMPLSDQALADASGTARSLIQLLPKPSTLAATGTVLATSRMARLPSWLPVLVIAASLVLIIGLLFSQASHIFPDGATGGMALPHASAPSE